MTVCHASGATLCMGAGIGVADMRLASSGDGQYLLIYCRRRIVAMMGSMGGDVDMFEFADTGCLNALELIERIASGVQDVALEQTSAAARGGGDGESENLECSGGRGSD